MQLSSRQNPKVKQLLSLYKRQERDAQGLFLIEGYRELSRAVQAGHPIETLFFAPALFLGTNEDALIEKIQQHAPVYECTELLFRALSYRDRPDGLIAIAPKQLPTLTDLTSKNPFYVVAEAIEKPGNLGTILRSADGAGVDGVIICERCTDVHNPNVVRASVGTLFTQPVVEESIENILAWLQHNHIALIATTPAASEIYTEVDLKGPIAILVGCEQYGLSQRLLERATIRVRIPMLGVADSLNVATATTLILYEAVRQRQCG